MQHLIFRSFQIQQLIHRRQDPFPNYLTINITPIQHLVRTLGGTDRRILPVLINQQLGCSVYVLVADHRRARRHSHGGVNVPRHIPALTGDLTFIVTEFGRPFSVAGFGNKFRKWCDEAGLKQCSAHGLRKAAAARMANIGCTTLEIMSITGHDSIKEVERYTKSAEQKRLARNVQAKFEG